MPHKVELRFNGVSHAYLREVGCRQCPQCSIDKPRANTSASLLVYERTSARSQLRHHLLFDCGSGVVDSLLSDGLDEVHHLFVSHCHFDHFLEVERLTRTQRRSGGPSPISLHASQPTWDEGPNRAHPYTTAVHRPVTFYEPVRLYEPGGDQPLGDSGLGIGLRITPVPVWHGPTAPGATIWVVEFGDPVAGTYHKLVLAWDMLHLIPRYPNEDRDDDYAGPDAEGVTLVDEHAILHHADELLIDANTCEPYAGARHSSILAALRFHVPILQPERTWFVHYSGHEDGLGPLSDDALEAQLERQTGILGLASGSLRVGRYGHRLSWIV